MKSNANKQDCILVAQFKKKISISKKKSRTKKSTTRNKESEEANFWQFTKVRDYSLPFTVNRKHLR